MTNLRKRVDLMFRLGDSVDAERNYKEIASDSIHVCFSWLLVRNVTCRFLLV